MQDKLTTTGLDTVTHKITISWLNPENEKICPVKAYFHLVWHENKLVGIDFDGLPTQTFFGKALLRENCRELTARLQDGKIDMEYICNRWIAQSFPPDGYCEQTNGMVKSVLDAAAKVFIGRYLTQ